MSSGWPSSKSDVWGVYYGHCEIVIIFTLWPVECKEVGTYNWGEPERAPHSRDLHHVLRATRVRLTSVDPADSV